MTIMGIKGLPFATGLFLTLASGAAYAAPSAGPSWEVFAMGAVGVIGTGFWFWVASVAKKQSDTEKMVTELQKALLSRYHPKEDISEMMKEVRDALKELRSEFRENQREWKEKFAHFESLYGR